MRTRCRCRCCSGWPTAGWPTSAACRRASSGWTPGSAGSARARRCRWPAPSTTSTSGWPRWTRSVCSRHAVSLPPFLFCTTADDERLRHRHRRRRATTSWPTTSPTRPTGCSGSARSRWAGRVRPTRPAGAWTSSAWPASPSAAAAAAGTSTTRSTTTCGRCCPSAARSSSCTPAACRTGTGRRDFWLPQLVGYPMETALAVARLVFGRVLERYPLNLCLAHGGGCLPVAARPDGHGLGPQGRRAHHAGPPSEFTDRLYYDTAVFQPTLLRRLVEDVGADHVMLGTDHPFELGDFTPRETVAALGLDRADTRRDPVGQRRAGCSACRSPLRADRRPTARAHLADVHADGAGRYISACMHPEQLDPPVRVGATGERPPRGTPTRGERPSAVRAISLGVEADPSTATQRPSGCLSARAALPEHADQRGRARRRRPRWPPAAAACP